jgi:hypothetical protein
MASSSSIGSAWQVPLQWPRAAERRTGEGLLKAAIVFAVLALLILDRFGLRLTAEFSIPPALMAMYGLLAAMLLTGAAELNPRGGLAYLAVVALATLSFLVNASLAPLPHISIASFLLLVVLYAPFAVALRPGAVSPRLWRWSARMYVALALFVAAAGIAQYFVQFGFQPPWLFDYTPLIPEAIRSSGGWNVAYSAGGWIKSNGFFLREPSIFSIAMAFALLCELSLDRRKWVLAVLGLALLLTYSGSGLLVLVFGLLFPLGAGTLLRVLALALVGAAVFFVLGDALNLSYTLNRVDELGSAGTSAYCRFIYPGVVALQQIDSSAWTALLGHGPGTMERMDATCADGHQTTYAKALFEYGLLGVLAFGALILGAIARSAASVRIGAGAAFAWLLLGGNLLAAEVLLFIYLLVAMWPPGMAGEAALRAREDGR